MYISIYRVRHLDDRDANRFLPLFAMVMRKMEDLRYDVLS